MTQTLRVDRLCCAFEDCLGWPYASPGSDDENGIDSSGMFVRAFSMQDGKIGRGSDVIWREYLEDKGALTCVSQLQRGYAVFNEDITDVGLVTRVKPLCIVHASEASHRVCMDARIKAWKYWGTLKQVNYDVMDGLSPALCASRTIRPLRYGDSGAAVRALHKLLAAAGFDVGADAAGGVYGKDTVRAVRSFQRMAGIRPDGIAGKMTLGALTA